MGTARTAGTLRYNTSNRKQAISSQKRIFAAIDVTDASILCSINTRNNFHELIEVYLSELKKARDHQIVRIGGLTTGIA